MPWTLFHGYPVKVPGCIDSIRGSLDLVPWLPGEGSWLPGLIHFLVAWTWFHGCLEKAPGCLDSLPGSLDMVQCLPGEVFLAAQLGSLFSGFGPMVS